jgi:hypothetical protein
MADWSFFHCIVDMLGSEQAFDADCLSTSVDDRRTVAVLRPHGGHLALIGEKVIRDSVQVETIVHDALINAPLADLRGELTICSPFLEKIILCSSWSPKKFPPETMPIEMGVPNNRPMRTRHTTDVHVKYMYLHRRSFELRKANQARWIESPQMDFFWLPKDGATEQRTRLEQL